MKSRDVRSLFLLTVFSPLGNIEKVHTQSKQGESKGPSIGLFWGTVIEGMLVVGGGNNDVYFSIEDSWSRWEDNTGNTDTSSLPN